MSSSYYPDHHEPTHCPTCKKRKENDQKKIDEKNYFKDFNPSTFKFDPQSIKHLFMMLLTLLNHYETDKDKYHDKEKHSKHPHHKCQCKCHEKGHHEWWKHEDHKHHDKKPCKCEEKYDESENKFRHVELKPHFPSTEHDDEFMMDHSDHSSSFEYDYSKFEHYPEYGKHKCPKCDKSHLEFESSSSEEMQKTPNHNGNSEMPDKIWLSDILNLLYRHNLLNLDHLFDQMKKHKEHDDKHQCKHCKKEKYWKDEYDYHHGKEKYTKEYYYKGIPLKKVKRKANPYKKFM